MRRPIFPIVKCSKKVPQFQFGIDTPHYGVWGAVRRKTNSNWEFTFENDVDPQNWQQLKTLKNWLNEGGRGEREVKRVEEEWKKSRRRLG